MTPHRDNARWTLAVTAAASIGALGMALLAQYGFNLLPCDLCYAQRAPYALTLVLGLLGTMPVVGAPERRIIIVICAALFAFDAGVAFYHVGVEQHWWLGPTTCSGGAPRVSMSDLAAALNAPGRPSCDQPAFTFAGISMAGYNFMAAVVLALGSAVAATRTTWWPRP